VRMKAAAAMLTAAGLAAVPAAASAAPGGYGPVPTGPAGAPGGYSALAATRTVGPAGGSISVPVAGGIVVVTVAAGTFSSPVQLEVTSPSLTGVTAGLSGVGFAGYRGVAGVGVKVLDQTGQPITGSFAKPLGVSLTGASLGGAGQKVLRFDTASSATVMPATLGAGSVALLIAADPDLAVVSPTGTPGVTSGTIAGATTPHTGKPFAGETALALALLCAAGGSLVLAGRRRTQH